MLCSPSLKFLDPDDKIEILFRIVWQVIEGGRVKSIVGDLNKKSVIRDLQAPNALKPEGSIGQKVANVVSALDLTRGSNNGWACK